MGVIYQSDTICKKLTGTISQAALSGFDWANLKYPDGGAITLTIDML
jgi:hypothetical protein